MPITPKLVETAFEQWKRWGFTTRSLHGALTLGGVEAKSPYVGYVNDYWRAVGEPSWNGATPKPWSAAFVSHCFKAAGAGTGFPYDSGHAGYCAKILTDRTTYAKLSLEDPATAVLAPGDALWAARAGTGCVRPPATYAQAVALLAHGGWFCSHCDVVVAVRPGEVDVIGGNVSDSVTQTTLVTKGGRIADPRHVWLGVIKNGL